MFTLKMKMVVEAILWLWKNEIIEVIMFDFDFYLRVVGFSNIWLSERDVVNVLTWKVDIIFHQIGSTCS